MSHAIFSGQVRACCMCSVPQNQGSIRKMPISHCTISGFVVIEIQRAIERWSGDVRNVLQSLVAILSFQNVALPNVALPNKFMSCLLCHAEVLHTKFRMVPLPLCLHASFVCEQSLDSD